MSTPASATAALNPNQAVEIGRSPRRADIQGLRAILMIQVLLYHAWTIGSPIGVDSFIMISAFLMTTSFVRRSTAGHMPFFVERWMNTFKRLLPPLAIVVLLTLGGSFLFLGQQRWQEMVTQAFASVTYWENWRLIQVAADYYAGNHALASPFQHLWSMSMQGQMFIIWPVLMTLSVLLARKFKVSAANMTAFAFGLLAIASLAWLIFFAPEGAERYFNTASRIWEFAFGSMIAAWAVGRVFKSRSDAAGTRNIGVILGWVALGVLVLYCLVPIGTYPGPMALVPLLCVSVLLLATPAREGERTAGSVLSFKPLVWLGGISYAVYLVHWPIFIFYLASVGRQELNVVEGVALIAASVALAWVITKLVDQPLQNLTWKSRPVIKNAMVIVATLALALAAIIPAHFEVARQTQVQHEAALAAQAAAQEQARQQEAERAAQALEAPDTVAQPIDFGPYPGALAMLNRGEWVPSKETPAEPIPGPLALGESWKHLRDACPEPWHSILVVTDNEVCTQQTYDKPTARFLLAGASHVQQNITPPMSLYAEEHQIQLMQVISAGCDFTDVASYDGRCGERNAALLDLIRVYKPHAVFLMVTVSEYSSPEERVVTGIENLVRDLTSQGIEVFGFRDSPRAGFDLYECGEWDPQQPYSGCLLERSEYLAPENPAAFLEQIDGFHMVDFTDGLCTDEVCPTIIGNVHAYIDNSHLSSEFSESMLGLMAEQIDPYLALSR